MSWSRYMAPTNASKVLARIEGFSRPPVSSSPFERTKCFPSERLLAILAKVSVLTKAALEDGMVTMTQDGIIKVLEGITKKIILEICKPHFEIKEEDIPLSKIKEYDELFITSTLYNILPVIQVDDITLSSNFEKTKIIQRLFKEYYDKNVLNAN